MAWIGIPPITLFAWFTQIRLSQFMRAFGSGFCAVLSIKLLACNIVLVIRQQLYFDKMPGDQDMAK